MPASRKDAVLNRERLLSAATTLIAEHGAEIDVREIARCAGVGMGTLYRHFPTKQALLDATLTHSVAEWVSAARAARTGDPWPDLCGFIEASLERHARDRGLVDCYTPPSIESRAVCCDTDVRALLAELVEAARSNGTLRADATTEDIWMLLMALGQLIPMAPHGWRRAARIAMDGLRATALSADER
ncbi:TetR/AcrR family transcriptional regulator [Pseudonocardia spinosispora]|uniref:TetR/AcrR family transcriptional regulator n=1 Tax=Pseudonocardia spinosispora TaxID=103441 RepID=UPI00055FA51A|nr:TetR/AcrR family transcriptional regulator [Pseudonocardia spinosispora]